jgi:hypothetical protein
METLEDAGGPANADTQIAVEIVRIDVERESGLELVSLEVEEREDLLDHLRARLVLEADVLIFERDKDEPLVEIVKGRRALRLVTHRHRQITVRVQFDHRTAEEVVAPSKTVFKVLQWAVSKKGFGLDAMQAAKANLILPGAEIPLPRDSAIGAFTQPGECVLVVDLTLKDFTNG